jgi:hypothetical protein
MTYHPSNYYVLCTKLFSSLRRISPVKSVMKNIPKEKFYPSIKPPPPVTQTTMPLLVLHLDFLQLTGVQRFSTPTSSASNLPQGPGDPRGLCFDDTSKAGRKLYSCQSCWLRAEESNGSSRDHAICQANLRVAGECYGWPGVTQY